MKQNSKTSSLNRRLFTVAAGMSVASATLLSLGTKAQAQGLLILSDGFSNGAPFNDALIGTSPDGTNLGGGVYGYTGRNDYDNSKHSNTTDFANHPSYASSRNGTAAGISIASNGSYVEPNTLTISAQINPVGPLDQGNTNNSANPALAVLGFYSTTQSSHYQTNMDSNFVGIRLSSTGGLLFDVNGTTSSTGVTPSTSIFDADGFASVQFTATFDPATLTATLSNLYVDGVLEPDGTLTTGTLSATASNFAGFGGNANGFPAGSSFTALTVTGPAALVPEPSTYALLAAGAVAAGATAQFRRRRQDA